MLLKIEVSCKKSIYLVRNIDGALGQKVFESFFEIAFHQFPNFEIASDAFRQITLEEESNKVQLTEIVRLPNHLGLAFIFLRKIYLRFCQIHLRLNFWWYSDFPYHAELQWIYERPFWCIGTFSQMLKGLPWSSQLSASLIYSFWKCTHLEDKDLCSQ